MLVLNLLSSMNRAKRRRREGKIGQTIGANVVNEMPFSLATWEGSLPCQTSFPTTIAHEETDAFVKHFINLRV